MTTLLDYLATAVREHSTRPAVIDGTRQLTYQELDDCSTSLAIALRDLGAGPGERVGIWLPSGPDAVLAVWAVLKTGAAYVPLDVASPAGRLGPMIDRIRPRAIITDGDPPPGALPGAPPIVDVRAAGRGGSGALPPARVGPDDPAYVLHTSGSTGIPKGVVLSHRNATAFVDWAVERFSLGPADRLAGHAPLHFDLSVLDLFGSAKAGAALAPAPRRARVLAPELAGFLRSSASTVLYCVPSALTMLTGVAGRTDLAALRLVLFAGEPCPQKTLRAMLDLAPQARFANLYGPTETNVCTFHEVEPAVDLERPSLPIGRAICPSVRAVVMAAPGREAVTGEPGELHVTGPTVALGYWGDPEQTAARFDLTASGARTYRTGDIVVRDADGVLRLRGRADRQVKVRGHRVELDEVEAALRAHPEVTDAAVLAVPHEAFTHQLVAFVATRIPISSAQLRRVCAARLPSHMIPSVVHFRQVLPRTSTGKLDRPALSAQLARSPAQGADANVLA